MGFNRWVCKLVLQWYIFSRLPPVLDTCKSHSSQHCTFRKGADNAIVT